MPSEQVLRELQHQQSLPTALLERRSFGFRSALTRGLRFASRWLRGLLPLCLLLVGLLPLWGAGDSDPFASGNKFYFEGKFPEAAALYEKLIQAGPASAALYFNLGNAYYKAGQNGRAMVAYLRAQRLSPRDPAIRFNLKFVREKVTGSDKPVDSAWQRWLASLKQNEWALLSAGAFWVWFGLLAAREAWPRLRPNLRSYTLLAGVVAILVATSWALAARARTSAAVAVVVAPEGIVRQGPLERASVAFKLPDGSEVAVLDKQEITDQDQKQTWFQVQDRARRVGWLKREQVVVLGEN